LTKADRGWQGGRPSLCADDIIVTGHLSMVFNLSSGLCHEREQYGVSTLEAIAKWYLLCVVHTCQVYNALLLCTFTSIRQAPHSNLSDSETDLQISKDARDIKQAAALPAVPGSEAFSCAALQVSRGPMAVVQQSCDEWRGGARAPPHTHSASVQTVCVRTNAASASAAALRSMQLQTPHHC